MILITGGAGMLGRAMRQLLPEALAPGRVELDLTDRHATRAWLERHTWGSDPVDTVVHLAGMVGGLGANSARLHDFYAVNTAINSNLIEACVALRIPRLVCCLSTCVYPDAPWVTYPLTEEQLHAGPPHPSNFGYAYAKRMVEVQLRAVRAQHGLRYISVIPNNLYGEHDNFDLADSHVIPALMRKAWEARLAGAPSFPVWGDGMVWREFTYAPDAARAILHCLAHYDGELPVNIGDTREHLLRDVVGLICRSLGFEGAPAWQLDAPRGQERKPSSNARLLSLGWQPEWYTALEDGLQRTCDWFRAAYPAVRGVRQPDGTA